MRNTMIRKVRLLIADDDASTSEVLATLFRTFGYDVQCAHDGAAAIAAASQTKPHAALLDLNMPRASGWEVAAWIRSQPWGAGVLLIALSGWNLDEHRQASLRAGFDHHLAKPPDIFALERFLERTLAH